MKKGKEIDKQKKIAKERIAILFQKAEETFPKDAARANRYGDLARRIAMKLNLHLSKEQKHKLCKHCYSFLQQGVNATTRIRDSKIITFCKTCKKYSRIPLTKKTLKKRV
ncbi:ribonuclease P [Candidatus Woesearchaeota archaeon]|nr:ribonuclease P [Candidatus Woesearchaeota archaeon]